MHTPQALAAVGLKAAGWPIMPLKPDSKRVDKCGQGFTHGHAKRLPVFDDVLNIWQDEPTRNVGVAPEGFIIADGDVQHGATLALMRSYGIPVDGLHWRTRSGGWQFPLRLPRGFKASKGSTGSKRLPGVDLLGPNSLAVMPWSFVEGGVYRFEGENWEMGRIPEDWDFLDLLIDTEAVKFGRITRADREAGRKLYHRLRERSEFRADIKALFGPNWQAALARLTPNGSGLSESHRDFAFAFCGTHFLRRNPRAPQILYVALEQTGWPQNPLRAKPKTNPKHYIRTIVRRALAAREAKDNVRLGDLAETYGLPTGGLVPCLQAPPDPVAAKVIGRPSVVPVIADVIGDFVVRVGVYGDAEFARSEGWVRVPCWDLADILNVSDDSVTRALKHGEDAGWWERETITYRHDGRPRVDSLVRAAT